MRKVLIHRSDGGTSEMTVMDDNAVISQLVEQWETAQFIDENGETSETARYSCISWEEVTP